MDANPMPRAETVADGIFAHLVNEILSGRWPTDRPAPSERELAMALRVNRHTVREALKRLQQVGLLEVRHGGKTRVLDWRDHAGLDLLAALANSGVIPPLKILRDLAAMRRTIGADAAYQCALRADDEQLAAVAAAADAYPASANLSDLRDADLKLWIAIIAGSNNVAYRLALNTLVRSIDDVGRELFIQLNSVEFVDSGAHRALAAAITGRQPETAARLADELLSELVSALQDGA